MEHEFTENDTGMGFRSGKPRLRIYVDFPLREDAQPDLTKEQAHYIGTVMRAKTGEAVALFNGRDGEWLAAVADISKRACTLRLVSQRRPQQEEPGPWLLFAPLKRHNTELIVEKATELGVSRLMPVQTMRTNSTKLNVERLKSIAIEAAEQCERLTIPEIDEPLPLMQALANWPVERPLMVLDETGSGVPLASVAQKAGQPAPGFVLGPEGGFDKSELDALKLLPFSVGVDLGPRILRAETAAFAALAIWQAVAAVDD